MSTPPPVTAAIAQTSGAVVGKRGVSTCARVPAADQPDALSKRIKDDNAPSVRPELQLAAVSSSVVVSCSVRVTRADAVAHSVSMAPASLANGVRLAPTATVVCGGGLGGVMVSAGRASDSDNYSDVSGDVIASGDVVDDVTNDDEFDDFDDDNSDDDDVVDSCQLSAFADGDDSASDYEDDRSAVSVMTCGSSCSVTPSLVGETFGSICLTDAVAVAAGEDTTGTHTSLCVAPLWASLFPHVPPVINFGTMHDKCDELPAVVCKLLRWRLSTITPQLVRQTLANSNFRLLKHSPNWVGTWGKHMKSECFKAVRDFQKINHFPGTFQIGRKDKLWRNIAALQVKFGKNEFGFVPRSYVLPADLKALKSAWRRDGGKRKWIIKPPASARGAGIRVVQRWLEVPKKRPLVVQRYISRPLLVDERKFDLRLYVYVTTFRPLRAYLYHDGLVRFASVKYSCGSGTLADRFMHLTNYSINRHSQHYRPNTGSHPCAGHKWTLLAFWQHLRRAAGVDTAALWRRVVDMILKSLVAVERHVAPLTAEHVVSHYNCHELFGFDVLIDHRLRPWLLEVNISPSLHSSAPVDVAVKAPLLRDLLNLAGFHVPSRLSASQMCEAAEQVGVVRRADVTGVSQSAAGQRNGDQSTMSRCNGVQSATSQPSGSQSAVASGKLDQSAVANGEFDQSASTNGNFDQSAATNGNFDQSAATNGNFDQSAATDSNFDQSAATNGNCDQSAGSTQTECTYERSALVGRLVLDKRIYTSVLSPEERAKHAVFEDAPREEYLGTILENLTPDDVRQLVRAEDELCRRGNFERIFPSASTHIYHQYMEHGDYYCRLFDAWEQRYADDRAAGVRRLRQLCSQQLHLSVPKNYLRRKVFTPEVIARAEKMRVENLMASSSVSGGSTGVKKFKKKVNVLSPADAPVTESANAVNRTDSSESGTNTGDTTLCSALNGVPTPTGAANQLEPCADDCAAISTTNGVTLSERA